MRALAATALTLAFVLMATITYVAVRQDPMGGEPRLVVKIAPPDLAKLQAAAAPPLSAAPVPQVAESATLSGLPVDLAPAGGNAIDGSAPTQAPAIELQATSATAADAGPLPAPVKTTVAGVKPATSAAAPAKMAPVPDAAAVPPAETGVEGITLTVPK